MTASEEEKKMTNEKDETVNFELFNDDFDNKELESLASSLAPRVTELLSENALDVLLDSYTNDKEYEKKREKNYDSYLSDSDDDEDGMNSEWKRLRAAEESLREELEMSAEYGLSLFYQNYGDAGDDENEIVQEPTKEKPTDKTAMIYSGSLLDEAVAKESNDHSRKDIQSKVNSHNTQYRNDSSVTPFKTPTKSKKGKYTLFDHADQLLVKYDPIDLQYPTCPMMTREEVEGVLAMPNFRIQNPTVTSSTDAQNQSYDEYGQIKLFTGEGFDYGNISQSNNLSPNTSVVEDLGTTEPFPEMKTTNDMLSDISLEQREHIVEDILSCTREYVRPLPFSILTKIFAGLVGDKRGRRRRKKQGLSDDGNDNSSNDKQNNREPLPIRTCLIRIRPDVLCGAVMDAINTTIETLGGEMIKRQGGHLRAVIPGTSTSEEDMKSPYKWSPFSSSYKKSGSEKGSALPPFVIDAQLVTRKKSRDAERILLLRSFSVTQGEVLFPEDGPVDVPSPVNNSLQNLAMDVSIQSSFLDPAENDNMIQEAAALVQRISVVGGDAVVSNDQLPDIMETPIRSDASCSKDDNVSSGILGYLPTGTWLSPIFTEISETHHVTNPSLKNITQPSPTNNHSRQENLRSSVTEKLITHAEPTLSVNKLDNATNNIPTPGSSSSGGNLLAYDPIPALSKEDWPFVQSSSRFAKQCLDELENRDLSYSTLVSCPFGAFPALPTLDVHYCSQIKLVCKENMVMSLLKAASELEQFARESEYSCAVMVKLMKSTFYTYDIEAPILPNPVPLTAYPLDFQPPESTCPPWGQRVLEALNYVAKLSSSENSMKHTDLSNGNSPTTGGIDLTEETTSNPAEISSTSTNKKTDFYKATDAVSMVSSAFQRQFDEEQSARLGRKNLQVMDRLAKMLAHKRSCISTIRDAYETNQLAAKAADEFHYYAEKYFSKSEHEMQPYYSAPEQIPLLTFRIILGSSTGTCYITANQMLLVTQSIPILGGHSYYLVPLAEIELEVMPPSTSILNPLPAGLKVHRSYREKESLFSFVPSISAKLLKNFVESLQVVLSESPEALKFSSKGGLLYIYDENQSVAKAALGSGMT